MGKARLCARLADAVEDLTQLDERLGRIEARLIQRAPGLTYSNPIQLNAKLAALSTMVGSADARPTHQAYEVFAMLAQQVDEQLADLTNAVSEALPALNLRLIDRGLGPLSTW
jgi:hypothetical protein